MLFAHLKRILKLDRLRLRGPYGARDEFHLAAIAQNLRKLAKLVPGQQAIPSTYESHTVRGDTDIRWAPGRSLAEFFNTIHPKRPFGGSA